MAFKKEKAMVLTEAGSVYTLDGVCEEGMREQMRQDLKNSDIFDGPVTHVWFADEEPPAPPSKN